MPLALVGVESFACQAVSHKKEFAGLKLFADWMDEMASWDVGNQLLDNLNICKATLRLGISMDIQVTVYCCPHLIGESTLQWTLVFREVLELQQPNLTQSCYCVSGSLSRHHELQQWVQVRLLQHCTNRVSQSIITQMVRVSDVRLTNCIIFARLQY